MDVYGRCWFDLTPDEQVTLISWAEIRAHERARQAELEAEAIRNRG